MSSTATDGFASALVDLDVDLVRTTTDEATDRLDDVIEGPAVGVDPGFVALPERVNADPSQAEVEAAATGVTPAELGVAEYGSVLVQETGRGEERASLYPERHVAVLAASDLEDDLDAAFPRIAEAATGTGSAVLVTGPSSTADMGELVVGVHGPRTETVVLVGDA